jgi:hypothetical protein
MEFFFISVIIITRDSAVGIVTGYELDEVGFRVPVRARISLFQVVQTGSGVHSTSCTIGTRGSFRGGKAAGLEADQSPPVSAEVMKMWICASTFPYAFMADPPSKESYRLCIGSRN